MKLIRRTSDVLLSTMFISGGWDAALRPRAKLGKARAVTVPVIHRLGLKTDSEQLVRINGGVQVAAGMMLAGGVLPRVAAATLAGSLVPTTLAGHRFWAEVDPADRAAQRVQFLKNLSMLGGLLLAATIPARGRKAPAAA